ncbi:glycerol-3-phosphate acyltransferase [Leptolyngbya sp. Cla-17]|uniref:glycerol-3-phosphate acyltransferase n=1 Tax=Leptolyngbya sp. Cla-17 TaxID=2803751 RepID=UPI0018D99D98|nr:glycerol-3-phosphate acyltransferase [Leptolyngbya sp. Cla-17]
MQVWGALVIFAVCPLLGGLPLIRGLTKFFFAKDLKTLGTGNISVSAAFYHGGRLAGILAVCSEALKGIVAVLLAKFFFPTDEVWEVIALIMLVMGRYWVSGGAGTTNVVWGYFAHDPAVAGLVCLIGGIGFTILRDRKQAQFGVLGLLILVTVLLHPEQQNLIVATAVLAFLLGWIYTKIPDDLSLNSQSVQASSRGAFNFFQGDSLKDPFQHSAIRSLNDFLDVHKYGQKAATLAHLKKLGYPVPMGWVLAVGDDPQPLIQILNPSPQFPLIVRSSAIGEDSEGASAAGQYESIADITEREGLQPAIIRCFESYNRSAATQYRRDLGVQENSMAVLIQQQICGVFSGVAFSRDPILQSGEMVVVEALPGSASQVVSGRLTPETYRVFVDDELLQRTDKSGLARSPDKSQLWTLPDNMTLEVDGIGEVPPRIIQQVAYWARQLETHYQGIPQDIEWSYDGQTLWLLQTRPITTLLPIWTRKIAAEVIPGLICPLTWSINRPLTCGVWGDLFTLVLGKRSLGLNFDETATLHYSRAYFNASLLGKIFRQMGLPPESLEFLTKGAKFSKPPVVSTLQNSIGLMRLLGRELSLAKDFSQFDRLQLTPALTEFARQPAENLTEIELLNRIDFILALLKSATYYSILAPLSAALRRAVFKVNDANLDNGATPEIAALRSLQALAHSARLILPQLGEMPLSSVTLFETLSATQDGQTILARFDQLLEQYGYLSEVGTDIAVPTWKEAPNPVRELFAQFCIAPTSAPLAPASLRGVSHTVQNRMNIKGRVTEIYSRLLAELRWSFVALEQQWTRSGRLSQSGDIFYLEVQEIRQLIEQKELVLKMSVNDVIAQRRSQLDRERALPSTPFLVYGYAPPMPVISKRPTVQHFQGIGASSGIVEGRAKIVTTLAALPDIGKDTILVVPYTDSGWAPLLARAGGLIAEVGGRLSHGAIVAREYQIPAVMDVQNATQRLQDGQLIRIDGQQGTIEILA